MNDTYSSNSIHCALTSRELLGPFNLTSLVGKSSNFVRKLELSGKLKGHLGCVNTCTFSSDGKWCLTGSDDCKLMLWDAESHQRKISFNSGHNDNIFSAKVMPFTDNEQLVSCAADGLVRWANLETRVSKKLMTHAGRAHRLALEPGSSSTFFSCGEDGAVYFFDLRNETNRRNKILTLKNSETTDIVSIYALSVDPLRPTQLIVAGSDPNVYLFDVRKPSERAGCYCPTHLRKGHEHVTGAVFNWCGSEVVATYNDELVYRFDIQKNSFDPDEKPPASKEPATETTALLASSRRQRKQKPSVRRLRTPSEERIQQEERAMIAAAGDEEALMDLSANELSDDEEYSKERKSDQDKNEDDSTSEEYGPSLLNDGSYITKYEGHRNSQTVKQVNWFGPRSEYVVSGSDCGHIFVWERESGMLETLMYGDRIGAVNCLESHPSQMALITSGLEHDAKIWRPTKESPVKLMDLKGRNSMSAEDIMERNNRQRSSRGERMDMTSDMLLSLLMGADGTFDDDSEPDDELDEEDAPRRRRFRLDAGILQLLSMVGRISRRRAASDNEDDGDDEDEEDDEEEVDQALQSDRSEQKSDNTNIHESLTSSNGDDSDSSHDESSKSSTSNFNEENKPSSHSSNSSGSSSS